MAVLLILTCGFFSSGRTLLALLNLTRFFAGTALGQNEMLIKTSLPFSKVCCGVLGCDFNFSCFLSMSL